jgi:inner membrane protein YhjD
VAKRSSAKRSSSGGFLASLVSLVAMIAVAGAAWRRPGPRRPGAAHGPAEAEGGAPSFIRRIDHWQRRTRGISFLFGVIKKFGDDRAGYLAALVSYFAFFSVLPLLLALTSVLGFVLEGDLELQDKIKDSAFNQIPIIGDTIKDNIVELKGSVLAIVLGVLASIWGGLRVVDAIQNALNEVWDVPVSSRPNILKRRLRGLVALGVLGLGLLGSLVASGIAGLLPDLPGAGRFGVYAVTFVFNIGLFLLAFKVLSSIDHPWGELLPGALVAAGGWFLLQAFGTVYLTRVFDDAQASYKNFGAVLALLTFFFVVSQLVIFAAEVNVVRSRRLWPRSIMPSPDDLTDADRRAFANYACSEVRVKGQLVEIGFAAEADDADRLGNGAPKARDAAGRRAPATRA